MHELALCQSVVDVVLEQARQYRFDRVETVRLEIGALSCVAPDALDFCFAAVARGTIADGARLEILAVPGEAWCLDCGMTVPLGDRAAACPRCAGYRLQVTGGEGMRIKDLEVA
ncbi:MAG: hydrogenase maturation nickel metallochaperone HypA [Rhodospirillales bacterium]|nr:hydrogenase maturation nickel metallochaperone HypA [Rhodospirillales bacterium]